MNGPEVDFRCVVTEDGKPCQSGIVVKAATVKAHGIGYSKYICKRHLERGYRWMHSFLEDPNMEIDSATRLELPKRANDLYLVKGKANPAAQLLHGYGTVKVFYARDHRGNEYVEDVLLLPLEDAKDPKAPTIERNNKTIGGGFALPPQPKDE